MYIFFLKFITVGRAEDMFASQTQPLLLPIPVRSKSPPKYVRCVYTHARQGSASSSVTASPLSMPVSLDGPSKRVHFSSDLDSVMEITPYSLVYGRHPRLFHFGVDGQMVPTTPFSTHVPLVFPTAPPQERNVPTTSADALEVPPLLTRNLGGHLSAVSLHEVVGKMPPEASPVSLVQSPTSAGSTRLPTWTSVSPQLGSLEPSSLNGFRSPSKESVNSFRSPSKQSGYATNGFSPGCSLQVSASANGISLKDGLQPTITKRVSI